MPEIGYTHSMFTGNLRAYAQKVDRDTANGGNNNGMIDGKEVENFKALVKKETGYDFSFEGITQSIAKEVNIQDKKTGWKYHSSTELAEAYRKFGASSKAIVGLNGGDPFANSKNYSAIVPFLSPYDLKSSETAVERQEAEISSRLDKKKAEQKAQEQKELHEATKSTMEKAWDWFIGLFK